MKIKRIIYSLLIIPIIGILLNLTPINTLVDAAYTILPNGNWSFGYVADNSTSYYSSLNGLQGQTFINKLSEIITANTTKISYGGGTNQTGDRLRYTDEYPGSTTNVLLLYSGEALGKDKLNLSSSWTWNQEHTWAKSHGFDSPSFNAYSDLHHLRPTYEFINSTRSSLDFGEVENYTGTVKTENLRGNKVISNVVFEPRDAVKGDVARMMMYMDVRYAGSKSGDPILTLTNDTNTDKKSTNGNGYFGNIKTLLKWHNEDPVDDFEKRRNDRIFDIQGNRNPFIDHPEYIEQVYNTEYTGPEIEDPTIDPDPEPDPQLDQAKADAVISAINNIGTVTINSKTKIDNASNAYNLLTDTQKALVTNYNVLSSAISAYEQILASRPDILSYSGDFDDISDYPIVYTDNFSKNLDSKPWYFSCGGRFSGETRIGKDANVDLPEKLKHLVTKGYYLEMQWNIENITRIRFSFKGSYGTINQMIIAVSSDNGATYSLASSVNSYQSNFSALISEKGQLRCVLIIAGTKPRINLDTVEIYVEDKINQLIADINGLGTMSLNKETYDALNSIESRYNALSTTDKNKITNYSTFTSKKNSFNTLVNNKASEIDQLITSTSTAFFADPFNTSIFNSIDDLFFTYYDQLDIVIAALKKENDFLNLINYYDEVFEYLELVYDVNSYFNLTAINEYILFYNDTFIKDLINSNTQYKTLTEKMFNTIDTVSEFNDLKTLSSIMFSYNNTSLVESSLKMRFGGVITKELYDKLIALDSEAEFGIIINNSTRVILEPARVLNIRDEETNENGNYYQFALVLTNIPLNAINTANTYQIYVKIEDEYIYMEEANHSFVSIAEAYILGNDKEIELYLDILNYIVSLK